MHVLTLFLVVQSGILTFVLQSGIKAQANVSNKRVSGRPPSLNMLCSPLCICLWFVLRHSRGGELQSL